MPTNANLSPALHVNPLPSINAISSPPNVLGNWLTASSKVTTALVIPLVSDVLSMPLIM